jgi:hypothetical protein
MFGAEAAAYPAVTPYPRAAKFPAQNKKTPEEAGVTRIDSVDAAILKALADNPFCSPHELSRPTCLSRSIAHRRLTESLGFTLYHLYSIPQWLSGDQNTIRINLSQELL